MSNNSLVFLSQDRSTPLTTSEIIASALDKDHKDVLALAKKYKADLKEFGLASFKTKPIKSGKGGFQNKEIVLLNEEQATLLITYMRNSEKVRKFKITLVKAFYEMKKRLMEQTISDRLVQVEHDAYNEGYADARECYLSKLKEQTAQQQEGKSSELQRIKTVLEFIERNRNKFMDNYRYLKNVSERIREIATDFDILHDAYFVSVPAGLRYINKELENTKGLSVTVVNTLPKI